jgi:GT2 family glycosyltransferase
MASAGSPSDAQSSDALGAPTLRASVVIPTHNRRDSLRRALLALAQQSIAPERFEALVICAGCTDGSVHLCHELASELPYRLRVIEQTNAGLAAARNRGVEEAQAQLIVFLSDDVVADPALLATHVRAHNARPNLVTIGPLLPPPDQAFSVWDEWENSATLNRYQAIERGKSRATERQFSSGNAAVRKRHLIDAGGFNPDFRRAEDVEFAARLGELELPFDFLPEARAFRYVSRSFAEWLKEPLQYAEDDVLLARVGYPHMLHFIAEEFSTRSPSVRALVRTCAGHRGRMRMVESALRRRIIRANEARERRGKGHAACGMLYYLGYYHQIATLLGGARRFHAFLRTRDVKAALAAMPAR